MNAAGLAIVDFYEQFRAMPYLCSSGVPTIGKGTTRYPDGRRVALTDDPIDVVEADRLRDLYISRMEADMMKIISVKLTDNQFSALGSLCYNIGITEFKTSTLLRLLNKSDFKGAADQFAVWNKGRENGQLVVKAGLVKRRASERKLFLTPAGGIYGTV